MNDNRGTIFKIECRCDGIYSGLRVAYLKEKGSDRDAVFQTREEARKSLPESKTLSTGTHLDYRIVEA